ncbi:MAG: hypothetical protein PHX84_01175 [Candidatus Shapirobacteria bacterium]|jgi:hypothetical protein|nr:hypothetical protein [Candidatus Shapirobacteria bacterium]
MNKSKISFYFIFIAFFTFITILVTIVQASYSNLMVPQKKIEEDKLLTPLNPVLDSEIIQEIEKRTNLTDNNGELFINNRTQKTNDSTQESTLTAPKTTPSVAVDNPLNNNSQSDLVEEENN